MINALNFQLFLGREGTSKICLPVCVPEWIRALFSWGAFIRLWGGTAKGKSMSLLMRDKNQSQGTLPKKPDTPKQHIILYIYYIYYHISYNAISICILRRQCCFSDCTKLPRSSSPPWSWGASFILEFIDFCLKQSFRLIVKTTISPELFLWYILCFGLPVFG